MMPTPVRSEVWFSDTFDESGPLDDAWKSNAGYARVEGEAKPEKPGNLVLSDVLPAESDKDCVIAFHGCKVLTETADGDNWFGAMEFSNGWTPERGIAIRLIEANQVQVCIDLNGPGEYKCDASLKLEPSHSYDFFLRFRQGGEVSVYAGIDGEAPFLLSSGGKAPAGGLNVSVYTDTTLLSISGVEVDFMTSKDADIMLSGSSVVSSKERKSDLPKSVLTLLDNVEKFNLKLYPIGFWNYVKLDTDFDAMNEQAVAEWAEMGCTVAQAPFWNVDDPKQHQRIKQILDWSDARGMKVILRDTRLSGPRFDEAINEFGHHPAMFGYHIGDELAPKEMMGPISDMTQKLQDKLPTLHTHYNQFAIWPEWELFPGYASPTAFQLAFVAKSKSVLLSYDNYTQFWPGKDGIHPKFGATGWDKYFDNLRIFHEVSLRSGVPFWSTICSASHMTLKITSYDQLAWQFHSAVCAGANGVEYFLMYQWDPAYNYRDSPIDAFWRKTTTYEDLRTIHQSFHRRYGDLFNRIVCTRVTFVGKVYGAGKAFTPNGLVSFVGPDELESYPNHPLLVGEFVDKEGQRYLMVVNNSITDSVKVKLRFPGKNTRLFSWDWRGNVYQGLANAETKVSVPKPTIVGDEIEMAGGWLAPGQEAVYRVDSDSARSSPIEVEK